MSQKEIGGLLGGIMQTTIVAEIVVTTPHDFANMTNAEKLAFIKQYQDNRIIVNITKLK